MKKRILLSALTIALGVCVFVYGGYDDSPGAQALGLIVAAYGVVFMLRGRTIVQAYLSYVRDNPKGYWFRARWYGWGWVPARWQGWVVIGVWLLLVLALAATVDERSAPREVAFTFVLPLAILTATLFRICWKTGERPRWNWGDPRKK